MKLLLKFNLMLALALLAGLAAIGLVTRELLKRNAQQEVLQHARFMMEKAQAVRSYTSTQIAPLLETQMKYGFLPQSVPAFSATEVLGKLQAVYPEYSYKEATLNPTNPRDRAADWEADVITGFRNEGEAAKEFVGQRDTPTGKALYIARPIRIADGACLRCHSTVDAAPRTLVERYGPANGFGWHQGEIVGAQMVTVPMALPLERAEGAWRSMMGLVGAVFAGIALALNAMLWWLVLRPLGRLAHAADRASRGDPAAPDFGPARGDEIGTLVLAFGRMRKSLAQALKMLEASP